MKKLNEAFLDEEFEKMTHAKEEYRKSMDKQKISWHDFLLAMCVKDDKPKKKQDPFHIELGEEKLW